MISHHCYHHLHFHHQEAPVDGVVCEGHGCLHSAHDSWGAAQRHRQPLLVHVGRAVLVVVGGRPHVQVGHVVFQLRKKLREHAIRLVGDDVELSVLAGLCEGCDDRLDLALVAVKEQLNVGDSLLVYILQRLSSL